VRVRSEYLSAQLHISSGQQHGRNPQGSICHESDSTAHLSNGASRGEMGAIGGPRHDRCQFTHQDRRNLSHSWDRRSRTGRTCGSPQGADDACGHDASDGQLLNGDIRTHGVSRQGTSSSL
jgi:hypothetical protein